MRQNVAEAAPDATENRRPLGAHPLAAAGCEPRPTVPGRIDDLLSFDLLPAVDAGETMDDALEFVRLGEDLRAGQDWDMRDKKAAMDEMEDAASRTG